MRTNKLTYGALAAIAVLAVVAFGSLRAPAAPEVEAAAGDPIYMKYDGIDGDVAVVGHEREIDVLSWSWGMSQSASTGGGGAGKVKFNEITITKVTDKASPKLMLALAKGEHARSVELSFNTPGSRPSEFMKIILEDVVVSSYSVSGSANDAAPTESLSLNYGKIKVSYQKLDSKGNATESPVRFEWDVAGNQEL